MNFLFLAEARRVEKEFGRKPAGTTWLRLMLNLFFWLPVILIPLILAGLLLLIRLDR